MASFGKSITTAALAIGCTIGLGACATEDYVDEHIATVNQRIDGLESRVQQVDGTAQSAAGAAATANQRLDQLSARMDAIEQRLAERQRSPRN